MYKTFSKILWGTLKLVGRAVWLVLTVVAPPLARRFQRRLTGNESTTAISR